MRAHSDAETAAAREARAKHPDWSRLLIDAVEKPGIISQAYSRFWHFSTGNQLLAMLECFSREIEPGPIHTFKGWLDLGRHVRKGERAISLVMPISIKRKANLNDLDPASIRVGDGAERQLTGRGGIVLDDHRQPIRTTIFALKPHWFVLSQTDGDEYVPPAIPEWNELVALTALNVRRVQFSHSDGNCQGYASAREVSVSPLAVLPHKTLFHELAHVAIGHTEEVARLDDDEFTPRNLREVEAEAVALICCESLNLGSIAESRGYIQHWLRGEIIPERSAHRIFKAADQILKAGRPALPHTVE